MKSLRRNSRLGKSLKPESIAIFTVCGQRKFKEVEGTSDNAQNVLEAMEKAGKPLRTGEIAEMTSLSTKEVSKIIKELKKQGKISSPKRCYYTPI